MAVDLADARAAYAQYMFADTITLPGGATVQGKFGVRGQGNKRGAEQSDMQREQGEYQIKLPLGTVIKPGAVVRFQGRVFRVVWTPPASALSLAQTYGLEEAR